MTLQTDYDPTPSNRITGVDPEHLGGAGASKPMQREEVVAVADRAAETIAPLWPLESFVAVNPFLGISGLEYASADNAVDRIWGARLVMPREFYAGALKDGRIADKHILAAMDEFGDRVSHDYTPDLLKLWASMEEPASEPLPTIATLLSEADGSDWGSFVADRISSWASGYFDEGQAGWRSPWRGLTAYAAWRGESELDRSPEILGIPDFRGIARTLPADADDLLHLAATTFELPEAAFDLYLKRLLASIAGWAGHARYRGWRQQLAGNTDARVKHLLAIRAAWDLVLHEALGDRHPELTTELCERLMARPEPCVARSHIASLILQTAFEIAQREPLLTALTANAAAANSDESPLEERPDTQAVFCIDVRSEPYRRALESTDDSIETLGFAGFFGFALEVAPIDGGTGSAQCPVLLAPQFIVREQADGASESENEKLAAETRIGRRLSAAYKQFAAAAVASFAFVESMGLAYAWRLLADGFGLHLKRKPKRLVPSVEVANVDGRAAGISLEQRIATAEGVLNAMSMTDGFGKIVALIGHGSTSANNPYASRFNCGACGGHTGEANALVAAGVLNDAAVRAALRERGIEIPEDTWFVAGLHDTTTDEVSLLPSALPVSHEALLSRLEQSLAEAGRKARRARAASFGIESDRNTDRAIFKRSEDWSEVRPEWGLAGCMAFIAAPRERTRDIDLGGRAFLHSYDHEQDDGYGVLELIMTAPLMVASWISLQYYASTVDNRVFGSGDKTLHNVVGGVGVLEGTGGDLRVGLPSQSLIFGDRLVHEPVRLHALIEAPTGAIDGLLDKHDNVRELVENGWIHLFAMLDGGKRISRCTASGDWVDVERTSGDPVSSHFDELEKRTA